MEFNTPTSKSEMYTILNDIFYYYRTKRGTFQELELQPLEIAKIEYVEATDAELLEIAETLVSASQAKDVVVKRENMNVRISEINQTIYMIERALEEELEAIEQAFEKSCEKVELQAVKNGLISSGIAVNKIAELESQKNVRISEVRLVKNNEIAKLESERITLVNELGSCEDYFSEIHQAEVAVKLEELKKERAELTRDVFEYNNAIDEKTQKYANTILQSNANMEIKYLEISSGEYNKDQLIEMGYYEDVINCVCGYYNTMTAAEAFVDLGRETKAVVYLEEYYPQILEMYRIRAGL